MCKVVLFENLLPVSVEVSKSEVRASFVFLFFIYFFELGGRRFDLIAIVITTTQNMLATLSRISYYVTQGSLKFSLNSLNFKSHLILTLSVSNSVYYYTEMNI